MDENIYPTLGGLEGRQLHPHLPDQDPLPQDGFLKVKLENGFNCYPYFQTWYRLLHLVGRNLSHSCSTHWNAGKPIRPRGWQHTISLYEISKSHDFNCDFVFQQ